MKRIIAFMICLNIFNVYSQEFVEKEIKTEVNEVTVFIEGAQVVRKKTISLAKGKTLLKFVNLSPFIDAKSIQVKANGAITVLSVNHQQNYIDKLEKSKELVDLDAKFNDIEDKLKLENAYLAILKEELSFLRENKVIGGKNQELSVVNFKEASTFYSAKMTSLKLKEIELEETIANLEKQKSDIKSQVNSLSSKKEFANGEVLVKVESSNELQVPFEISYLVSNAGWFPSYDLRANSINGPIELVYKANVKQDTKVDWKNVKLKFSSSEPNVSGVAPVLKNMN